MDPANIIDCGAEKVATGTEVRATITGSEPGWSTAEYVVPGSTATSFAIADSIFVTKDGLLVPLESWIPSTFTAAVVEAEAKVTTWPMGLLFQ